MQHPSTCTQWGKQRFNPLRFWRVGAGALGDYLLSKLLGLCWLLSHQTSPTQADYHSLHDDVIKWKHFPRYCPFVRGIHRSPVNSPHNGQWRGALMFSLICAWINGCVNNGEAGDLRSHRAHYDVTVMYMWWNECGCHWTSYLSVSTHTEMWLWL